MADACYVSFRQRQNLGVAPVQPLADNIKVVLVDAALYTPNINTDQFLSDIPAGARVATSGNLTTKTMTAAQFDADDVAIAGVPATSVEYLVVYQDTGVAGTSQLMVFYDTAGGLPFTTSSGTVTIVWGAYIYSL